MFTILNMYIVFFIPCLKVNSDFRLKSFQFRAFRGDGLKMVVAELLKGQSWVF
jgi:hypothetical protein